MANAFARRFQQVVDQLSNGNKRQFAEMTGRSVSHIYKICRGKGRPSMAYLESLYDEFKVDLTWLLTGEQGEGGSVMGSDSKDIVFAPMFDVQASAGPGTCVNSEDISDYFAFSKSFLSRQLGVSGSQLAFVTISGDSMIPTFQDGDQVLVDMTTTVANTEGSYLLQTEDGLMAKRLRQNGSVLKVTSDNPEYASWEMDLQKLEDNPVLGRIVWCARVV